MKKGFTLVELLIVIAILIILTTIMAGTLNPGALVGKGNDAKRKKDLGRIKVALEEYFNDRHCYPSSDLITAENIASNCGKNIFGLTGWPCDPVTRQPYIIVTDISECPRFFKIFTQLDNKNDKDIPVSWGSIHRLGSGEVILTEKEVNYGTSSTNVKWYDGAIHKSCSSDICSLVSQGSCQSIGECNGPNCFYGSITGDNCIDVCRTASCKALLQ